MAVKYNQENVPVPVNCSEILIYSKMFYLNFGISDRIENPDHIYLLRAQKTLATVREENGQPDLPVEKTWRLNER